jgi:hypothetical protein
MTLENEAFQMWWNKWVAHSSPAPLLEREAAEAAWLARAERQQPCRGVAHPGCHYLAPCGSVCNKCGQFV